MYQYFDDELKPHGFNKGPEAMREIVEKDVILNTMGLEFWLDNN
jgi:hypothetical protein